MILVFWCLAVAVVHCWLEMEGMINRGERNIPYLYYNFSRSSCSRKNEGDKKMFAHFLHCLMKEMTVIMFCKCAMFGLQCNLAIFLLLYMLKDDLMWIKRSKCGLKGLNFFFSGKILDKQN